MCFIVCVIKCQFASEMAIANIFHIAIIHVTVITECLSSYDMLRMCYFNAEARYRNTRARFDSANIDFSLCTHYIYAYGRIDRPVNTISPVDPGKELGDTGAYRDFTTRYVSTTSKPKRLLSIGGPNVTAHNAFIALTSYESNMRTFSRNAMTFLRQHRFAGLDIDWQYPTTPQHRGDLVKLLEILRTYFDNNRVGRSLLLTVRCPGVYNSYRYDVSGLSTYADYVILAAYNYTPARPGTTSFGSPLYSSHLSVNTSVGEWLHHGLPVNKTVVGISAVGRYEMLVNELEFNPGAPVRDLPLSGFLYNISHGLAYPEVCDLLVKGTAYFDQSSQMHYAVTWKMWVGYEDTESINSKIYWMRSLNIAGVMFAGIDEDDFTGAVCGLGSYPLLRAILRSITIPRAPVITTDTATTTTTTTTTTTSTTNIAETTQDSTQSVEEREQKKGKDLAMGNTDTYFNEYMITAFAIFLVAYAVFSVVMIFAKRETFQFEGMD